MIIKTKEPINLIGIGEFSAGACVSFYANFLPREQGIICHSEWYSNQENCDSGNILFAHIAELNQKENIVIKLEEFTKAQIEIMEQATIIIQDKVMQQLNARMNVGNEKVIDYLELV